MSIHGCQVKGSLVLVIPEVQMFHFLSQIFPLFPLILQCLQPLSRYRIIHIDGRLTRDLRSTTGWGMAQAFSQASDKKLRTYQKNCITWNLVQCNFTNYDTWNKKYESVNSHARMYAPHGSTSLPTYLLYSTCMYARPASITYLYVLAEQERNRRIAHFLLMHFCWT